MTRKMIKTVKELTLQEIISTCKEYRPSCRKDKERCPLYKATFSCDQVYTILTQNLRRNKNTLDQEIIIKEELQCQPTQQIK